jgi:hypothetical protein
VVADIDIWGFSTRTDAIGLSGPPWGIWAAQSAMERRDEARYAPIAVMSGLTPTMFITRVRLGAGSNPIISTAWDE